MATTPTGSGAVPSGTGTGNTPSGNPGAGTHETSSAPDAVSTPAGASTAGTGTDSGGAPTVAGTAGITLSDSDFKQDGTLRADSARRISEAAGPRGAARSYNEVTDETAVTTSVDGRTVTFTESGDTRSKE